MKIEFTKEDNDKLNFIINLIMFSFGILTVPLIHIGTYLLLKPYSTMDFWFIPEVQILASVFLLILAVIDGIIIFCVFYLGSRLFRQMFPNTALQSNRSVKG